MSLSSKGTNGKTNQRIGFFVTAEGLANFFTSVLLSHEDVRKHFYGNLFGVKRRYGIEKAMDFFVRITEDLSKNAIDVLPEQKQEILKNIKHLRLLICYIKLIKGENV